MQQNSPVNLVAGATVAASRLVKLSSGQAVHNTATHTDRPVGVAQVAGTSGLAVSVRLLTDGTVRVEAAGAITKGHAVYAAADGKVQALPAEAATYRKVGTALEAASGDGSLLEIMPEVDDVTQEVGSGDGSATGSGEAGSGEGSG